MYIIFKKDFLSFKPGQVLDTTATKVEWMTPSRKINRIDWSVLKEIGIVEIITDNDLDICLDEAINLIYQR